jgi:hypothetical protein
MKSSVFFFLALFGLSNLGFATDIALRVTLSKSLARVGDTILCDLQLMNEGADEVGSVKVRISPSEALSLVDTRTTKGTYDRATGVWFLENITSSDKSMKLTIRYVLTQSGPSAVAAEVISCSNPDRDSKPDNGAIHEDDIAYGTVTVPIVICGNMDIDITAYALPGFKGYQWKKDEQVVPGESGQSLRIREPGYYTYLVLDNEKMSAFSAPIIVERGDYPLVELGDAVEVVAGKEIFITPKVQGGLAPYRYKWTNDINWNMKRKLKKNEVMNLRVKVTDRRGCISTDSVRITVK